MEKSTIVEKKKQNHHQEARKFIVKKNPPHLQKLQRRSELATVQKNPPAKRISLLSETFRLCRRETAVSRNSDAVDGSPVVAWGFAAAAENSSGGWGGGILTGGFFYWWNFDRWNFLLVEF